MINNMFYDTKFCLETIQSHLEVNPGKPFLSNVYRHEIIFTYYYLFNYHVFVIFLYY